VADYYSILSKAVSALEPNTASARLRLYERARSAMSAEIERASPPFDATDIAAAKHGLKSAIERIEAEALPTWIKQPDGAVCANDCPATADLPAEIEGASPPFDASETATAERGLENPIERIEAEVLPAWLHQPERAVCTSNHPATADVPAEIEGASAIARIEAEAIPEWLRQPERAVRADDCPATAANQNEDSPGPLKRLWTRATDRSAGSHTALRARASG
jgi:hypothetical protein